MDTNSASPNKLIVGKLAGAFGVKGWLKIVSYTDPRENIFDFKPWFIRSPGQNKKPLSQSAWQVLELREGKVHGKGLIGTIDTVIDRNQAEELKGYEIAVLMEQLPSLAVGDYYWHQLTGLVVTNVQGECLGRVKYMLETGANDVLVVQAKKDDDVTAIDEQERLIPYLPDQVVLNVDLAEKAIIVDWPSDY